MAKRKAEVLSASESDAETQTPRKRPARPRASRPPLYKASVKKLADTAQIGSHPSTADIDNAIIQRIKKCLARAKHPTTPEAEAKIAVFMASKLMDQYNISQVEVFKHEPPSAQSQYSGASWVSVKRVDGDAFKPIRNQSYVGTLALAMENFFECKSFVTADYSFLEYTFYGIATNTVGAAMAFEMAYNLIAEWARRCKGTASMNSYCHGVADELWRMSKRKKKSEEKEALKAESDAIAAQEKAEEAERQGQLDRLAPLPALSDNDSSEDEDWYDAVDQLDEPANDTVDDCNEADFGIKDGEDVNPFEDFEEEMKKFAKPLSRSLDFPAGPADETGKVTLTAITGAVSTWTSHHDLVIFRNTAAKIADDWVKASGEKLCKDRKRKTEILDRKAYKKGVEDSKKIDLHRRRIEEG